MIVTLLISASLVVGASPDKALAEGRARELVDQLGHPSFKMREKAAEELERLGSGALVALRKGIGHPDTEISERCRKLLPMALDHHLQEQIEVFLAKPDGPIPEDLPGIRRWLAVAGKAKESRELYALLVKEQRRILIEIEQNPEKAGQRYAAFCQDVYARNRGGNVEARKEIVSYSELALFFFLGGDPNCRRNMGTATTTLYIQSNVFLNSNHVAGMLSGAGASDATRKIFLSWLEQERYATLVRRGFQLAATANLKETVPMAIRVASDKTTLASSRAYALLSVAKLIGANDLKLLDGLMKDDSMVGRTTVNGVPATCEMRDIALGVAVQATGQKPADYGFERFRDNVGAAVTTSYYYYSLTDKQREEAIKKWKEWSAANKK